MNPELRVRGVDHGAPPGGVSNPNKSCVSKPEPEPQDPPRRAGSEQPLTDAQT